MDAEALPLTFLLVPFAVTLILTGIHVYLGLHVLSRGIIFVDLALAQVAALGTTAAFLAGHEPDSTEAYFWALAFTLFGAVVFAATRRLATRVPQEAIIGIVYAVASAAMILAVDWAPHGAEHIRALLVRDILWVQDWAVAIRLAAIYAALGLFHFLFRSRFLTATFDPEGARSKGVSLFLWDLLFYGTFGVVVTSSVQVAGVLLVFSYLMVPAVMGALLFKSIAARLAFGWAAGFVVSVAGLYASFRWDLPTGTTVVVTFGAALLLLGLGAWIVRWITRQGNSTR
jgi:zinc/manganese transport system permease protein